MSRLGNVGAKLYRGEVSINFVGRQRLWYTISGLILLVSIVALLVRGLDFSVDFKGGAIFTFSSPSSSLSQVQNAVESGEQVLGFGRLMRSGRFESVPHVAGFSRSNSGLWKPSESRRYSPFAFDRP